MELVTPTIVLYEYSFHFQLAKKYHPDVAKDSTSSKKFQEISEAYEVFLLHYIFSNCRYTCDQRVHYNISNVYVLSEILQILGDDAKRKEYDTFGMGGNPGFGGGQGGNPFPGSFKFQQYSDWTICL